MRLTLLLAVALAACAPSDTPRLETAADSLAFRITEGAGGLKAWAALPGLAFEWAVVRDSAEVARNRHVWDKHGDRARSEWRAGTDSVVVAVFAPSTFDPEAPTGQVAMNGVVLSGADAEAYLVEGHARFVNDGYWLLAPLKVLDPGVRRTIDATSGFDELALAFEGVGLTPGDRYWIETDGVTGAMTGWRYVLESGNEGAWQWVEPAQLATESGPVVLSRMKVSADGRTVILTEPTAYDEVPETEFTDLTPHLGR